MVSTKSLFSTKPQHRRLILFDAQHESRSLWVGESFCLVNDVLFSLGTAPTMTYTQIPQYVTLCRRAEYATNGVLCERVLKKVHRRIKKKTQNGQIPVLMGSWSKPLRISGIQEIRDLGVDVQRVVVHPFTMGYFDS